MTVHRYMFYEGITDFYKTYREDYNGYCIKSMQKRLIY